MGSITLAAGKIPATRRVATAATGESVAVRWILIGVAVFFLALFIFLPLAIVFSQAFAKGIGVYWASLRAARRAGGDSSDAAGGGHRRPPEPCVWSGCGLGIGKFEFVGKSLLITLIDLPFSVSPVVSGLIYVLLFGLQGLLGPWLARHDLQIIFAVPGIVLATIFVTFPFVARELIPLLQAQGQEEEEAALALGASGWQTFFRVSLPNIKWGLLYGVILCNARAMGEFGAVSVVSGHIRGRTNTMPLHVEILYNEYQFSAAFAVASLLALLALTTLLVKTVVEWRARRQLAESAAWGEEGQIA